MSDQSWCTAARRKIAFAIISLAALAGCTQEVSTSEAEVAVAKAALGAPPEPSCVTAQHGGHDYWFCPALVSWETARDRCQAVGTDLVHIDNEAENVFVWTNAVFDRWIGANDRTTEGAWVWDDDGVQFWQGASFGTVIGGNYEKWDHLLLQPNNGFSEDCGIISAISGLWFDTSCSGLRPYVCEDDGCDCDGSECGLTDGCGGSCGTCGAGELCSVVPDGTGGFIGECIDHCTDGIQSGDEEAVDCGGSCEPCNCEPNCAGAVCGAQDGCGGQCGGGSCELTVPATATPANHDTAAAASAASLGDLRAKWVLLSGNTSSLADNTPSIGCGSSTFARDAFLRFSLSAATTVEIDTEGSAFDTVVAVFPGSTTNFQSSQALGCDDDAGAGNSSLLTLALSAGQYYVVLKGDELFDQGTFRVSLRDANPPLLTCGAGGPNVCGTGPCVPSCGASVCGATDGCGGSCGVCDVDQLCVVSSAVGSCVDHCDDGVRNGSEIDVDCGGACTGCSYDGDSIGGSEQIDVRWDETAGPQTVTGLIGLSVRNGAQSSITVDLDLVGIGVGAVTGRTVLGSFALAGGETRNIDVALAQIPVQSISTSRPILIEARYGAVTLLSHPLDVQFAADFASATIETSGPRLPGGGGSGGPVITPQILSLSEPEEESPANAWDSSGRYRDETGAWADLSAAGEEVGYKLGHSVTTDASAAVLEPPTSRAPSAAGPVLQMHAGTNSYRICTTWQVNYNDEGTETQLSGPGFQQVPHSFGRFLVTTSANVLITQGSMDADGCSPAMDLEPGDYTLWQFTDFFRDGVSLRVHNKREDADNRDGTTCTSGDCVTADTTFLNAFSVTGFDEADCPNLPLCSGGTLTLFTVAGFHRMGQVSAFMAHVIRGDDHGLVPGVFEAFVDQSCPSVFNDALGNPTKGACANANGLFVGWNQSDDTHANRKFVLGHEFGHVVQDVLFGFPFSNYDGDIAAESLCRCDQVTSSNAAHCLQSREIGPSAQIEGWGHGYAANLFNGVALSSCNFSYYKEFQRQGTAVLGQCNAPDCELPPIAVDCGAPFTSGGPEQGWMANHCPRETSGTEYDWLGFFRRIISKTSPQGLSMSQVGTVWKNACVDPNTETPPGGNCDGFDFVTWEPFCNMNRCTTGILPALEAAFAADPMRSDFLKLEAENYGVDF